MPSNHLIVCRLLLLPPSIFPSIRIFSSESVLHIRWPKYWSFSFSISPSNEHPGLISFRVDWLDLLAVQGTLKSLFQHHSLKASIPWRSAFFMVQLSYPYTSMESLLSYRLRMVSVNLFSCWINSFTRVFNITQKATIPSRFEHLMTRVLTFLSARPHPDRVTECVCFTPAHFAVWRLQPRTEEMRVFSSHRKLY